MNTPLKEWWNDKSLRFPTDPGSFDMGDTPEAILKESPFEDAYARFMVVLKKLIVDETRRNIIAKQMSYSLKLVGVEVREAVADVFFSLKNPEYDSGRLQGVTKAPVEGLVGKVQAAIERMNDTASSEFDGR